MLTPLFQRLYGGPVIRNDLRGELVEEIIGGALAPESSTSGLPIQAKQSAAMQAWAASNKGRSSPRFSIAPKSG